MSSSTDISHNREKDVRKGWGIDPELRVEMEIPQPLIQSTFSKFIESGNRFDNKQ